MRVKSSFYSLLLIANFLSMVLIHFGCEDDLLNKGSNIVFDEKEALIESVWGLLRITTKYGTHNPDEAVPLSQMEVISSGNKLKGEIDFTSDSTIIINNASDEFYFKHLNGMSWSYQERFIRFKHLYGGFGYKVIWYGNKFMKWYIESVDIHSGQKSVKVIELIAIY